MFKNVCKQAFTRGKEQFLHLKNLINFSTKLEPQQRKLQDWEYVQRITKQLKANDINQALKYLIQSHLNSQILNRQIYYVLQQKMQQQSVSSSYHQVLYKLYRENFQPNKLVLNWMKKISQTDNPNLLQLLKKDYELLDENFPFVTMTNGEKQCKQKNSKISSKVQTSHKNKQTHKQVQPKGDEPNKEEKHNLGRKSRKVPTAPSTDDYFSKSPQTITITKKQKINPQETKQSNNEKSEKSTQSTIPPHSDAVQSKSPKIQIDKSQIQPQSIRHIEQVLQNLFKQYGSITLHNVELTVDNNFDFEQMSQMYNSQQNYDEQDQEDQQQQEQQTVQDHVMDMLSSISKIKIGRIELSNSKFLQTYQNHLREHNFSNKSQTKNSQNNKKDDQN